ncbi:MAG TPA: hypothetical protein VEI73_06260 [Candidatus Acidoferrum sp.]|nr:hypothetical protein [Candidatus Acidoferrum sp.]
MPISPLNRNMFAENSIKQLQEWDLPSKVTAWKERPSREELARQWQELDKKYSAGVQDKDKAKNEAQRGHRAPYRASPLPAKDWESLGKWFAKNASRKLAGACVDSAKPSYILVVGLVGGGAHGGSPSSLNGATAYNDYNSIAKPDSFGANAATVPGYQTSSKEFDAGGLAGGGPAYTCVYFYRTKSEGSAGAGTRMEFPEYYYCHEGADISQSTVTTMLKYLEKAGLRSGASQPIS